MGWSSGGEIFDPVARELVLADLPDDVVATVLASLIRELCAGDWDTLDESVQEFRSEPAVMAAFKRAAPDWLPDDLDTSGPRLADIEAKAWRNLLDSAESVVEDELYEDEEQDEAEFDRVHNRTMALIYQLRKEKGL